MSAYDEVEIEDMEWSEELGAYTYPCPCGDLFQITLADLRLGEEIARCPSCSLFLTVVYNEEDFADAKEPPQKPPPAPQPVAVGRAAPRAPPRGSPAWTDDGIRIVAARGMREIVWHTREHLYLCL